MSLGFTEIILIVLFILIVFGAIKKESQRSPFFSAKMQAYGIGFPENGRCFSR